MDRSSTKKRWTDKHSSRQNKSGMFYNLVLSIIIPLLTNTLEVLPNEQNSGTVPYVSYFLIPGIHPPKWFFCTQLPKTAGHLQTCLPITDRYCIIIIIMLLLFCCCYLLSQVFSTSYFSWNNADPHRSGFKIQTARHSVLCMMFQV